MVRGFLFSLAALMAVASLRATPGDLDSTFGSNGVVISKFGTNDMANASSIALQQDGKIIVGGFVRGDYYIQTPAVVRYLSSGALDTNFGVDGCVSTLGLTGTNLLMVTHGILTYKTGLAFEPDGRILFTAVGYPKSPFDDPAHGIFRFHQDGTPDASFDGDGYRLMSLGPITFPQVGGLARQPDGKILFSGTSNGMNVVRLETNGSTDYSFGGGGIALAHPNANLPSSTVLRPDGGILVAGMAQAGTNTWAAIGGLHANGSTDTSFGDDGKVMLSLAGRSSGTAIALQADGKIVVGGWFDNGPGADIMVARFFADGALDPTFGSNGVAIATVGPSNDVTTGITLQADGKIVLCGRVQVGSLYDSMVLRLTTNGALDSTFGSNGVVVTSLSPANDYASDIAIQADGKIVTAGVAALSPTNHFSLVRYESGVGPAPEIDVRDATNAPLTHTLARVDFGSVTHATSNTVTLTIHNTGYTNLTGLAVAIDGTNNADFVATQPFVSDLLPGSNTTFTVTFTTEAIGQRQAVLHVLSSDLDENPFDVNLVGRSLSHIEAWRLANFDSPDDSGPGADMNDFEFDGIPNLMEFAVDGHPREYGLIPATLNPDGGELQFTYARNKNADGELGFVVEWSDTLLPNDWHTDGVSESIVSDDGVLQHMLATVPAGPGPARFVRLRVIRPY